MMVRNEYMPRPAVTPYSSDIGMPRSPISRKPATWWRRASVLARNVRRRSLYGHLQSAVRHAQRSFIEYHAHATFKTRAGALIGMIGFPVFYFVWRFALPQPYESALLRAIGFALCGLLYFLHLMPLRVRNHGVLISYLTLWYTVPFFFTLMLLLNGSNVVWQMSLVSGFIYLVLLCDTINAFVVGLTASVAAYLVFVLLTGNMALPAAYIDLLPVLAFVLCGVAFLNYSDNLIIEEKMAAIGSLAAHIAHEMRTPLLGIRLDAEKMQTVAPELMSALNWAKSHGWPGRVSPAMQQAIPDALRRIGQHTASANSVIDMLLMNAAVTKGRSEMAICSARRTIETALERYHFRSGQRDLVKVETRGEFEYAGVEVLMVHVFFNLLKNALRAIEKAGRGEIFIELRPGQVRNEIVFRDTGPGMAPEVAQNIFLPFYSNEAIGIGTGIGLSFSRSVLESFDGTITCSSDIGTGTEFVLSLPLLAEGRRDTVPD